MNRLKCSVDNCVNYQDHRCCLDAIEVAGPHSDSRQETCCNSFQCAQGGYQPARNSVQGGDPTPETEIRCTAKKCVHNHGGSCDADCVCVGIGNYDTNSKKETQCETFATHNFKR